MLFPYTRDQVPLSRSKPTVLDPNNPKARQTYVPAAESFEEYMKRSADQGKKHEVVQAKQQVSFVRKAGGNEHSVMYLRP